MLEGFTYKKKYTAPPTAISKACSKCKEIKPLCCFKKDKRLRSGVRADCKTCSYEANSRWRDNNREKVRIASRRSYLKQKNSTRYDSPLLLQIPNGKKRCFKCFFVKSEKEFGVQVYKNGKVQINSHCKLCRNEYNRDYQKRTKEGRKITRDTYRRRNPAVMGAIRQRRRARELSAKGAFTKFDILNKLEFQGYCCFYCKKPLSIPGFHIDHKIPLSRGGTNFPANIAIACGSCNTAKNKRTSQEFLVLQKGRGSINT